MRDTPPNHEPPDEPAGRSQVRAWDLPTRVFHWTLVTLIISAYVSFRFSEALGDTTLKWHRYNGYAVLVLLVWRILWGVVGSSTSRWSAFVHWPWHAVGYGWDLLRGRSRHYLGHNPLGSWMILAVLSVVAGQAILGLFTVEHNDAYWGPLYNTVSEATQKQLSHWHVRAFYYVLLPLLGLHISANVLYGLVKKDPLIRAMVTGRKPAAPYRDQLEAVIVASPLARAFACLLIAAGVIGGGIVGLGGKLLY
jgi:cytochrome b